MEEDLIIGDNREDIIDQQLEVIANMIEAPNDVYDDFQADKVKIIVRAMKIIHTIQGNILKEIK